MLFRSWFHEGYWNFERQWHGDAVAKQYLEPWGSDLPPAYTEFIGDQLMTHIAQVAA